MKITLLGTGTSTGVPIPGCRCDICLSSDPRNKRFRVSAYVELQGRDCGMSHSPDQVVAGILIDTPPDLRTQALTFGIQRVDAVLYTHTHADHIFGIDDLRSFNFVQRNSIPIYASHTSADMLEQTFRYCFHADPDYEGGSPPRLLLHRIEAFEPLNLFDFEIMPLTVAHGAMEVYAYRFADFAYVTDCSSISERSADALRGVKVLVLDGLRHRPHKTHFTVEQAAEVAAELQAGQTYLTHISHEVEHSQANSLLAEIASVPIELGYDGLQIEL